MDRKDLEISEDIKHEQLKWKIERIGWLIMLVVVIAALLGLLGSGILSSREAENGNIKVEYNYFGRSKASDKYNIYVLPKSTNDSIVIISFNKELLQKIKLDRIDPSPVRTIISKDKIGYEFFIRDDPKVINIIMLFEPEAAGLSTTEISSEGNRIKFSQFFYP